MKKIISFSLSFIVPFLICYLVIVFVSMEWDMFKWVSPARLTNIIIPLGVLFLKWVSWPEKDGK